MLEENKEPQESDSNNSLKFETKTKNILAEIAKWGKFVSIIGFVLCGILLIVSVAIVFLGDQIGAQLTAMGQPANAVNSTTGIVYAFIAVLYYFMAKHIYDFSVYMKQAVQYDDQESIDYSFDRLRAFFKFIGVLAIIAIGFYGFAFILTLLSGVFGGGA
ncbi:MAG TPA: DUF5362 family protein [Pelobium sp.]|nr:DUF5362 family protein [Pelobium sp.]